MCLEKKMVIRVEKANENIYRIHVCIFKGEREREYCNGRAHEEIRVTPLWKRLAV